MQLTSITGPFGSSARPLELTVIESGQTVFNGQVIVTSDTDGVEIGDGYPLRLKRRGRNYGIPAELIKPLEIAVRQAAAGRVTVRL